MPPSPPSARQAPTCKTWTCKLRDGVKFHDGAALDANDVVLSYAVQWDTKHPLHKGRAGTFEYWPGLWGGFLNPPRHAQARPSASPRRPDARFRSDDIGAPHLRRPRCSTTPTGPGDHP